MLASSLVLINTTPYINRIPIRVTDIVVMLYPHLNSVYYLIIHQILKPVRMRETATNMIDEH